MAEKVVLYDSVFGNTAKIAEAIGEVLGNASVVKVTELRPEDLEGLQILFIGSPTRAFRPTPAMMSALKSLGQKTLSGVRCAVFDTRYLADENTPGFLKILIKLFGYADPKLAKAVSRTGATLTLENAGFAVSGTEGPLLEGELARAQDWARQILTS